MAKLMYAYFINHNQITLFCSDSSFPERIHNLWVKKPLLNSCSVRGCFCHSVNWTISVFKLNYTVTRSLPYTDSHRRLENIHTKILCELLTPVKSNHIFIYQIIEVRFVHEVMSKFIRNFGNVLINTCNVSWDCADC